MSESKIVTYNVHGFIGTDKSYQPERNFKIIKEINADLVALQEVKADNEIQLNKLQIFARENNYELILGPTIIENRLHAYGNAILSRHKVLGFSLHNIGVKDREPRGCILLKLLIKGETWTVAATHLGLKASERNVQLSRILELISEPSHVIFMGDFNEWFPRSRNLARIKALFPDTPSCKTFPSFYPFLNLDRIWVRPANRMKYLHANESVITKKASDHLPLVARIETPT